MTQLLLLSGSCGREQKAGHSFRSFAGRPSLKKNASVQLSCPRVNKEQREMYKMRNRLGHLQRGNTKHCLRSHGQFCPVHLGDNKTGRALFVNSRNQRTFLVRGVKHSRANSVRGWVCEEEGDPDSLKRTFSRSPKASGRAG